MTSYPCNKYEQITPSYLLSVKQIPVFLGHAHMRDMSIPWTFLLKVPPLGENSVMSNVVDRVNFVASRNFNSDDVKKLTIGILSILRR